MSRATATANGIAKRVNGFNEPGAAMQNMPTSRAQTRVPKGHTLFRPVGGVFAAVPRVDITDIPTSRATRYTTIVGSNTTATHMPK